MAEAGNVFIHADSVSLGAADLGSSIAGNLTVSPTSTIDQRGSVSVQGVVDLTADHIELTHWANDFVGPVHLVGLGSNSTLTIHDANHLSVSASGAQALTAVATEGSADVRVEDVNTVRVSGRSVVLGSDGQTTRVQGDLELTAQTRIEQMSAVQVEGQTSLTGNEIVLNDPLNNFVGRIQATGVGANSAATVANSGDLAIQLQGVDQATVNAQAGQAEVSLINAGQVDVNAASVVFGDQAFTSTLRGNLNVAPTSSVTQKGAIHVGGSTNLTAHQITLDDSSNNFADAISVSGTQADSTLSLSSGGHVLVQVEGMSLSRVQAEAGQATVSATHSGDLDVTASSVVLGETALSGGLSITSSSQVAQTAAVQVQGAARFTANQVNLNNSNNQFEGGVTAVGSGAGSELHLTEQGDSDVQIDGVAQAHLRASGGQARVALNNVGSVTIQGDSVVLGQEGAASILTGDLTVLSASSLTQQGAVQVQGQSQLAANQINLTDTRNRFGGQVSLAGNGSNGEVNLAGSGLLSARVDEFDSAFIAAEQQAIVTYGQVGDLRVQGAQVALGGVSPGARITGDLHANATGLIDQTAALRVNGETHLSANQVELQDAGNRFGQSLYVTGQGNSSQATVRSGEDVQALFEEVGSIDLNASGQQVAVGMISSGSAQVSADHVHFGVNGTGVELQNNLSVVATTGVEQSAAVRVQGASLIESNQINLVHQDNDFTGEVSVRGTGIGSVVNVSNLNDLTVHAEHFDRVNLLSGGVLSASVNSVEAVRLQGDSVMLGQSSIEGDLQVLASTLLGQSGAIRLAGAADFNVGAGQIELDDMNNEFASGLTVRAHSASLSSRSNLLIDFLQARTANLRTQERLLLRGNVLLGEGNSQFVALSGRNLMPLSEVGRLMPAGSDVFSEKLAFDPTVSSSPPLAFAATAIEQVGGVLSTQPGGLLSLSSPEGAGISLVRNNQIRGQLEVLSGTPGQAFSYQRDKGLSLVSVLNLVDLTLGGQGMDADVVTLSAPRLGTAQGSKIRARLPYDDLRFGVNQSYPALVLAIGGQTNNGLSIQNSGFVSDGNRRFTGIQVDIGNNPESLRSGFATVLPFAGAALVPGVVVFLEGPQIGPNYSFFYDGAGSPLRVPISYNGVVPLGTSASDALNQVTSLVTLASNRQRENVVQTENVTSKLRTGVVVEAGPGRPATDGEGTLKMPNECSADENC